MTEAERLKRERALNERIAQLELDLAFETADRRWGYVNAVILGIIIGLLFDLFLNTSC